MKSYLSLILAIMAIQSNLFATEAGMPQLNPEFWAAQIFWLLLIFSMLYIVIWKIFLPKITDISDNFILFF